MLIRRLKSFRQVPYLIANYLVRVGLGERTVVWWILCLNNLAIGTFAKLPKRKLTIDSIGSSLRFSGTSDGPLVTVIMPMYNSAAFLSTAVNSLIEQSYRNFELIIVDDASTDESLNLAKSFAANDSRIRVVTQRSNRGAYAARNAALKVAAGEFVTVHDADDWSHPKKLEVQVRHLLENPSMVGNLSEAVRVASSHSNSFEFFPIRGRQFIRPNVSSLMFRREKVLAALGGWDEIRYGADSEFHERMLAVFPESVATLRTGPLAFTRVTADSLTARQNPTHFAIRNQRWFYIQRFHQWHRDIRAGKASALLGPEGKGRPFAVPNSLTAERTELPTFKSALQGDVCTDEMVLKIGASSKPVAIMHTSDLTSKDLIHPDLLRLIDFKDVHLLFPGEKYALRDANSKRVIDRVV